MTLTPDPLTGTYVQVGAVPPLVDLTGLAGRYVIVLSATAEGDWATTLERQLGLKLDRRMVAVEVIVIDSARS